MRFQLREYSIEKGSLQFKFIPTTDLEKELFEELSSDKCSVAYYGANGIILTQEGYEDD